jgi:hypothetical protein
MLGRLSNTQHDAFQILGHVVIGEPEHTISARGKPFIAPTIVAQTLFKVVALAIQLNDQPAGMRDEVRDVVTHRALPTKSYSSKAMGL